MSNSSDFCFVFSDDPSPRLSAQAQAAEDILDKYRNAIKRTSPNEGVAVSYDSTGLPSTMVSHAGGGGKRTLATCLWHRPANHSIAHSRCVFRCCRRWRKLP